MIMFHNREAAIMSWVVTFGVWQPGAATVALAPLTDSFFTSTTSTENSLVTSDVSSIVSPLFLSLTIHHRILEESFLGSTAENVFWNVFPAFPSRQLRIIVAEDIAGQINLSQTQVAHFPDFTIIEASPLLLS